jgi:DNA helicase-2/ATP-dependent DNA helicase PcrA
MEPSMFIAEIQEQHALPAEPGLLTAWEIADFQALLFTETVAPEIEQIEKEFVARLLDKFVMNVTALNNYLKCPLEFYFKNLIRIPSPKNEATEFGSAVHHALEQLFRKMQDSESKTFPPEQDFVADFEWFMNKHRESFTKEEFARRIEYGKQILPAYYNKYIGNWNEIVTTERFFKAVINEVPIKGKLDKLEFDGNNVNVVDYKTGDPEKAKPKMQPPNDKEPNGGDYWRQAVFYKILVDKAQNKWNVVSSEFDFIEPDKKKNYSKHKVAISAEDITTVSQQIKTAWEKIQNHEFYIGCGKEECHWCSFVKTNDLAVELHTMNEEEEPVIDKI